MVWLIITRIIVFGIFIKELSASGGYIDFFVKTSLSSRSLCCLRGAPCETRCQLFLKICLASLITDSQLKCDIGQAPLFIPLNENGDIIQNKENYRITLEEKLQNDFSVVTKILKKSTNGEFKVIQATKFEGNSSKSWTTQTTVGKRLTFVMSYRFRCKLYFYGDQCNTYCRSKDDINGHYRCLSNGSKECLPGWKGAQCHIAICEKECKNYGRCVSPNTCECSWGWNGTWCDQCIPLPGCLHGRCRVKNSVQIPFSCECLETWNGFFCNIDGSYCQKHNSTCFNGGTCINQAGLNNNKQYKCVCPEGYSGTHCEKAREDCMIHGCSSHGKCQMNAFPRRCRCQNGYYGDRCQFNQTKCEEKPCQAPNSVCIKLDKGFKCKCPPGFKGKNCEIDIDECMSSPCKNGGSCVDRQNGYECVCPVGYVGAQCQIDQDDCHNLSCANGGHCQDLANSIACSCPIGFTGRFCEERIDQCRQIQPCSVHGTCVDILGKYECICKRGYRGPRCFEKIIDCSELSCLNGGKCIENKENQTAYCRCTPGFIGDKCDKRDAQYLNIILIGLMAVLLPLLLTMVTVLVFIFVRRRRRQRHFRVTHERVNNKLNSEITYEESGRKLINSSLKINNCSPMGTPYSLPYNQMYPENPVTTSTAASRRHFGRSVCGEQVEYPSKECLHELDHLRNSSMDIKNSYPSISHKSRKFSGDSVQMNMDGHVVAMKPRSRVNSMSQSTLNAISQDKTFYNSPLMTMYGAEPYSSDGGNHYRDFHRHMMSTTNLEDHNFTPVYGSPPPPYTLAPSNSHFSNSNLHTVSITPMPLPRSRSITSEIRYLPAGSSQVTQV